MDRGGVWTHIQRLGDLANPSFLVLSPDHRYLYSAHGDERYVTSFEVSRYSGELRVLGQADSGGLNGVHLAFSPDGRFVVVANYSSGSVAVLPVRPDRQLANKIQLVELPGTPGPHRIEQTGSHPHQIVFDPSGKFVVVPDKGLDRIFVFRFDATSGRLTPAEPGSVGCRSGSGPRHLAFHPKLPVAWALNELSSTVTTYAWDVATGALKPLQIVSSLPADFTGESTAAEIVTSKDGQYVYCSNRGHDSVGIFQSDPRTGQLTSVAWTPSSGKSPRFMTFDPASRFLYVANEQSDTIAAFRAESSGRLTATGQPVANASPVSIVFLQGD